MASAAVHRAPTDAMPRGQRINAHIEKAQVKTTPGGAEGPEYDDDAAASIVYGNYERARAYLETNSWLLNWQWTDRLYQSPYFNQRTRLEDDGRTRITRFLVWKTVNTMRRQLKRALFAQQQPFVLRATSKTDEKFIEAWTALLAKLCERANFKYNVCLLIDSQVLQGTGIGKPGWTEKKVIKYKRRRKKPQPVSTPPVGPPQTIPTVESDEYVLEPKEITESWPFFEYRPLGHTLFDPKWNTPNRPDLSAKYALDCDYVNFKDLVEMRQMDCYKSIPSEEVLKDFFFNSQTGDAPSPGQIADQLSAQNSGIAHSEGQNRDTSTDPLDRPLLLIEQTSETRITAVLCYEGKHLTIRNEENKFRRILHNTANWSNIDNSGLGIGIGRVTSPDQRINQAVINEALKMIAYPMNAPILIPEGTNAPTQNIVTNFGRFWSVKVPQGGDLTKAAMFMPMPQIPPDAWKFIAMTQQEAEDLSGANSTFAQGNLGGPGSSAARTATGASRIASMSDATLSDPVDAIAEGVIQPFILFLMEMVRERMPYAEIRSILSDKLSAEIIKDIDFDGFMDAEFNVEVLAGQKLQAKQGIMQMIPFFLQIVQQPQLLEYLHQRGETVDFQAIMQVFLQMSELQGQPDFFRPLTPQEKQSLQQMNPGIQRVQAATAVEQMKGQNEQAAIAKKGEVDLTTKAAEIAMEHASGAVPLNRAEGLLERKTDQGLLQNGVQGIQ